MSSCDAPSLRESPRARAWATRREKYGEHGHAGSYRRPADPIGRRALATVISLHLQETLSEGQCCAALNIDRVSFRAICDDYLAALEGSRKDGSSPKTTEASQ
jgi:hypothetical protein